MLKKVLVFSLTITLVTLFAITTFANKSSIEISAPANAKKGEVVTIVLKVTHNGNSYFHYTNWVYVRANGKEIGRWEFTKSARPENETFTREVKITITGKTDLEAEAHCNMHGSDGIHKFTINSD